MQPSVQIRIDVGGSDGLPHTFLFITHPDGSTSEYGLVPAKSGSISGDGRIDRTGDYVEGRYIDPHEYQAKH